MYRIVCADGSEHDETERGLPTANAMRDQADDVNPCGPHTVEPIAPDPTDATG